MGADWNDAGQAGFNAQEAADQAWIRERDPGDGIDPEPPMEFLRRIGESTASRDQLAITATQFDFVDPSSIGCRPWLYDRELIRGNVSMVIAPGGVGKSSLTITEGLALTTGRQLLHDRPRGQFRVWIFNAEDPVDELQRRVLAAMEHHGITPADIGDRLFVDSGRRQQIKIATMGPTGVQVSQATIDALIEEIRARQIDVFIVDPLVAIHAVPENDNGAMDLVVRALTSIADLTGCAILVVHHTKKLGGEMIGAEAARGASSLVAAARCARALAPMTEDEAKLAGVETKDRYRYVKITDVKANLAPRDDVASWVRIVSVALPNGDDGGDGDLVGVVEAWQWPDAFDGITGAKLRDAQDAIAAGGPWRENCQANDWVGKPIAEALSWDVGDPAVRKRVRTMISTWVETGALVTVTGQDEARHAKTFVEVGRWAT